MKFLVISMTAAAVATAAVIDPTHGLAHREVEIAAAVAGSQVTNVTIDDVFWGSLVQTPGNLRAFDSAGVEFNVKDVAQANGGLDTISEIVKKWGTPALNLFKCVGAVTVSKCASPFVLCGASGVAPWVCAAGIACAGPHAVECVQKLVHP